MSKSRTNEQVMSGMETKPTARLRKILHTAGLRQTRCCAYAVLLRRKHDLHVKANPC